MPVEGDAMIEVRTVMEEGWRWFKVGWRGNAGDGRGVPALASLVVMEYAKLNRPSRSSRQQVR